MAVFFSRKTATRRKSPLRTIREFALAPPTARYAKQNARHQPGILIFRVSNTRSMTSALALSRGDLLLSLPPDCVGFVILLAIVPGLMPQLLAQLKLLLRFSDVDLVRMQRGLGE